MRKFSYLYISVLVLDGFVPEYIYLFLEEEKKMN
jgi:hypothetical protein